MKGSENDLEEFRRRWREELRGVNSADHSPSSSRGIPAGYVPTTSSPAETSRSDKVPIGRICSTSRMLHATYAIFQDHF